MANPSPLLTVTGTAHSVETFTIPAKGADDRPRMGCEVTVLTTAGEEGGGFLTCFLDPELTQGNLPRRGEPFSAVVRTYVRQGNESRRYPTLGCSIVSMIVAPERARQSMPA